MSEKKTNLPKSSVRPRNPLKGESKTARIPIKVVPLETPLPKPRWIRTKSHTGPDVARLKQVLREHKLNTVCEEAACPNLGECFTHGTATFMIMGEICTRRCPFCDVAHGRPQPLDADEAINLASTIRDMGMKYVVITSVDRDDLRDGGAKHFSNCIEKIRKLSPEIKIEILTPDFRGRMEVALQEMARALPDVFNHNLETIPRLYKAARPGADYQWSLTLLKKFKSAHAEIPTKSGLMVGLGETNDEILEVMRDMREHHVDMLTIGQYLQPGQHHLPVERYVPPETFDTYTREAEAMGFKQAACGPMVRSSYHADQQAAGI